MAIMVVYGLACIAFAFVDPPRGIEHFFRVPAIFVFLPERFVRPAGRIFTGLVCLGFAAWLAIYVTTDHAAQWNRNHRPVPAGRQH
jgi:hypothetical protein